MRSGQNRRSNLYSPLPSTLTRNGSNLIAVVPNPPATMTKIDEPRTDSGLLRQLRDLGNSEAWRTFVARYRPLILTWCRQDGLDAEAAEDVLQDVLGRLQRRMQTFTYDPSGTFRGW